MNRKLVFCLAVLAAVTFPVLAGQYHSGQTLYCYDCHTPHASMQHGWTGGAVNTGNAPPNTVSVQGGYGLDWLPSSTTLNPEKFLLKLPPNELCLACHDNTTFAPDVYGDNVNTGAGGFKARNAGALNGAVSGHSLGAGTPDAVYPGYSDFKGHTLASTVAPPGFNQAAVGITPPASGSWYDATGGLECVSCHAQHGPATAYRNLGPYAIGANAGNFRPTYYFSTTADSTLTKDVRINLASYTGGSGVPATFNAYYDFTDVQYQRLADTTQGTTTYSNKLDLFCGSCHGDFHGGPGNTNIGASIAALDGFIRHPTSGVSIGAAGAMGYGGHSVLTSPRPGAAGYVDGVAKVPVYTNDHTAYTNSSPGCVSCHKAHGNQNPFGLVFMAQGVVTISGVPTGGSVIDANGITEEGAWETLQVTHNLSTGQRNLCGQCHTQGND